VRRRNEREYENTKIKDRKRGEDRRDDNERTGSDLSKTVGSREGAVTRVEEKRNGATRLPAFDEARRGGLNTRGGGRYICSKTFYKGKCSSENNTKAVVPATGPARQGEGERFGREHRN
jgi:hypothetical protein